MSPLTEPEAGVEGFITNCADKALNLQGYFRRITEQLTTGALQLTIDKFVCVPRGDALLCSRGSLLPMSADQIANGDPVRVAHPDMTRVFVLIPGDCELVTQAAAAGRDGEAIVGDTGESVRIIDLPK